MRRKIFRVEQMRVGGRAGLPAAGAAEQRDVIDELKALRALAERRDDSAADAVQHLKTELALIHAAIVRNKRELTALIGSAKERRMARAAGELGAAVDGMEKATVRILKSAEIVDDSAKALAAALKTDYQRGLAQDIQDHVVHIYEACNFQDLAGQRIGNVIGILNTVEQQVEAMLERCDDAGGAARPAATARSSSAGGLLNGPRLDGDCGHASQRDIDEMFG